MGMDLQLEVWTTEDDSEWLHIAMEQDNKLVWLNP